MTAASLPNVYPTEPTKMAAAIGHATGWLSTIFTTSIIRSLHLHDPLTQPEAREFEFAGRSFAESWHLSGRLSIQLGSCSLVRPGLDFAHHSALRSQGQSQPIRRESRQTAFVSLPSSACQRGSSRAGTTPSRAFTGLVPAPLQTLLDQLPDRFGPGRFRVGLVINPGGDPSLQLVGDAHALRGGATGSRAAARSFFKISY